VQILHPLPDTEVFDLGVFLFSRDLNPHKCHPRAVAALAASEEGHNGSRCAWRGVQILHPLPDTEVFDLGVFFVFLRFEHSQMPSPSGCRFSGERGGV
ncbi:MAG: hypothetical protein IIX99_03185, partial [Oscillospiraceae bacterium]|nr:hypothetical protein [Oscillospiraceae bacterium]